MHVVRWVIITLFLSLAVMGCSPKSSDIVVLQVGPSKVSLKEYEDFFTRNGGGTEIAQQSSMDERERFLDLLTDYKLKLLDAYDRNLMNDSDIVRELREYRGSLASTYILEHDVTEPGMHQLYERRKEEIRAAHILIKVGADAAPEDTLSAFTKATDIIRRIKAGERFDSLCRQNSDDPASKNSGGDLYYFTGGQMVTPFENAAYAMKVGEVTALPVRSSFGYHIIKILDRGPAHGSIKVRHIMTRFKTMNPDSSDTTQALQRISVLMDSLKKGADFSRIAMRSSEDQGSQQQGGDLGWFERRRWILPFDEAAFKLKPGENSGIIRTPYGYHILHCDSISPPQSYDEVKDDLKKLYQQRRYNEDYAAYMDRVKRDLSYRFDEGTFNSLVARLDSTRAVGDSAWDETLPADVRALALMSIRGRDVSLDTVVAILGNRPEFKNTPLRRRDLRARVDRIAESLLLEAQAANLETRFPEFGVLMREYNDGVILYKAEQMEVWNKTSINDSSLRAYYELNKSKFMFPERVNIAELNVNSDTLAAKLYDSLSHGADFAALANRYNESPSPDKHGGERGLQPADSDTLTKRAAALGVKEISEPFLSEDGGFTIIKLLAREAPRVKTFDEAGAEVSNAYQEYLSKQLEQQWLDRIRLKYPVIQYKDQLRNAFPSSRGSR